MEGLVVLALCVASTAAIILWTVLGRRRSERGAEATRRIALLPIRSLDETERERFSGAWQRVLSSFVEDPTRAIGEADDLAGSIMGARGFPVAEFDHWAVDLAIDHPLVVVHYRDAHEIALLHGERRARSEDLNRALVHYRALVVELLGEPTLAAV